MLDGFKKDDPPTVKKMPCTIDLPEQMASWGLEKGVSELEKAASDLGLVAMYYLLQIGEDTIKRYKNNTKQTEQFKMQDVTFSSTANVDGCKGWGEMRRTNTLWQLTESL